MPIGAFEKELLRLLANNRNPESFVRGATVLHQSPESPRQSEDVDLFHDTERSLEEAVAGDLETLGKAGFQARITSRHPTFCRVIVERDGLATKLEWVFDSAFRFFPVEPDLDLGWRLNFWDAATNKALACAGREKLRDFLDLIYLHQQHLSLGALAWAAAGKDPGLTLESIIEGARRHSQFPTEDLHRLHLAEPVDFPTLKKVLIGACADAEALFVRLPPAEMGCFYLDAQARPVCPNPSSSNFEKLTRHFGSVKGAWPRIREDE